MTFPFLTIRSRSNELTLAEVIARLGQHATVEGVLLIGSTYEQLADLTLAPVGGLWPEGNTALQFDLSAGTPLDAPTVSAALAFWEELLGLADSLSR